MDKYQDTIDWLFTQLPMFQSLGAGAYKPGLDTAYMLAEAFGNPHKRLKTIHVGGTNGKGSTSHSLAAVLMKAGYKVGLFTSPHLVDFRERIRVNGEKITKDSVVDFVERYREKNLPCNPSFFELTTIMAFDYFASEGVDYAIIEVGLGGRLDTTNIIIPELTVITNVSLDHIALLGDTEEAIAKEKAGIIKAGVPVVIGESEGSVKEVFRKKAEECGSQIFYADENPLQFVVKRGKNVYTVEIDDKDYSIESDLTGDCQNKNATTLITALNVLRKKVNIPVDAIVEGMANVQQLTGLMGRWMVLKAENPIVVCDTGHNIGAWRYLAPRLAEISKERTLRMVLGFANDKDVESIFNALPKHSLYYFVTPSVKRARSAESLLQLANDNGLNGCAFDSVVEGYKKALADSGSEDFVFVGGSNFVVAEILS